MDEDDPFDALPDIPGPKMYDREGNEISWKDAARLKYGGDGTYHIVAKTEVGRVTVSTVWLGMDHNWGDGPPLIFETMCFADSEPFGDYCERYSNQEAALAGHDRAVMWAREQQGITQR